MKKLLIIVLSFIMITTFLGVVGYVMPQNANANANINTEEEETSLQIARRRHHRSRRHHRGGYHRNRGHHRRHHKRHHRRHRRPRVYRTRTTYGGPPPPPCFIATEVYGTSDAKTNTLREFRNKYLMTNEIGKDMVSYYYEVGPEIAVKIGENKILKPVVKTALLPFVGGAYLINMAR